MPRKDLKKSEPWRMTPAAVRQVLGPIQDHLRSVDRALPLLLLLVCMLMVLLFHLYLRVAILESRLAPFKEENERATPEVTSADPISREDFRGYVSHSARRMLHLSAACN